MPVLKRPACACRRYVCVLRAAGAARTGWAEDQQDRLEQFVKKFPRTACLASLEQAEYQVQEAMKRGVANWSKTFLRDTNAGLRNISQAASMT